VAEVLYDLAVIRLANDHRDNALPALETALELNPKLQRQAAQDGDLDTLRPNNRFSALSNGVRVHFYIKPIWLNSKPLSNGVKVNFYIKPIWLNSKRQTIRRNVL
jgi:hypothetical protein